MPEQQICYLSVSEAPRADSSARPLQGIPLAARDEHRLAGKRRTSASPMQNDKLFVCPTLTTSGVPTGVQCVVRGYDDRRAFAAALAFEREFDAPPWRRDSRITRGD